MHKIDGAGHVNEEFVIEDLALNRPPTEITAEWLNAVQGEIANVITSAGLLLHKEDNTQLALAIANMLSAGTARATALEAQTLTDLVKLLTPKRLDDAFKGANQLLTGTSNFQRLPGGTRIQMGTILTSSTADVHVTFPEMYSSAPRGLIVNHANYSAGSTSSNFLATPANITNAGFDVSARVANTDTRAVVTVSWLAFS